ncbi:MAG: cobalamin-binding protein [Candidatus Riflebacteria bacterium]|nr:cobalamin-binding protein [Candidatus Riflebacteria bacterium]
MKHLSSTTLTLLIFLLLLTSVADAIGKNRIISLVPSQTELIFHLGLGEQIVGVSDYCNYPEEARNIPRVGAMELNIERIMSLRPTLLVDVNSMHKKYAMLFSQLGLNYINFTISRLEQLPQMAEELTKIIGEPAKGHEFATEWRQKTESLSLKPNSNKPKVYFEIWDTPMQAAGHNSYIGDMIQAAGGENIFNDTIDFPVVNTEAILSANPDAIIIAYPLPELVSIKNRPGWKNLRAVKSNQIYAMNQDLLIRPGPRNLEALKQLKEIFGNIKPGNRNGK